jgi:hypothetical protein
MKILYFFRAGLLGQRPDYIWAPEIVIRRNLTSEQCKSNRH